MNNSFEYLLARHCAPVLSGCKPASLLACVNQKQAEEYKRSLKKHGVYIRSICSCHERNLLLVYRKNLLERHLRKSEVRVCLAYFGYPAFSGCEAMLDFLQQRIQFSKEFPHEIGIFMGYPIEDVLGFIRENGKNCKLCGYWKVYGNPETAQQLFKQYDQCRKVWCEGIEQGRTLHQMLCAV